MQARGEAAVALDPRGDSHRRLQRHRSKSLLTLSDNITNYFVICRLEGRRRLLWILAAIAIAVCIAIGLGVGLTQSDKQPAGEVGEKMQEITESKPLKNASRKGDYSWADFLSARFVNNTWFALF
jgi:hypothetical protein